MLIALMFYVFVGGLLATRFAVDMWMFSGDESFFLRLLHTLIVLSWLTLIWPILLVIVLWREDME